jgi:glucokinase
MWLRIDVGGSKLAALADGAGAPLQGTWSGAWTPSGDAARDVARIVAEARRLLDAAGRGAAPRAVGVCAPGPLDSREGVVQGPPNLPGWRDVPLVAWLEREFGCPVALENDANAAALAEWQARSPRPASLVYLTLSTGIGAGLVLDGRLYRGARDLAGEIGHAPVVWDGEPCACGLRGASRPTRAARPGRAGCADRARGGRVAALAGGRSAGSSHVAAAAGDARALELERWNEHLARALVAIAAFAPDAISLGTIACAAGERSALARAAGGADLAALAAEVARAARVRRCVAVHAALAVAALAASRPVEQGRLKSAAARKARSARSEPKARKGPAKRGEMAGQQSQGRPARALRVLRQSATARATSECAHRQRGAHESSKRAATARSLRCDAVLVWIARIISVTASLFEVM